MKRLFSLLLVALLLPLGSSTLWAQGQKTDDQISITVPLAVKYTITKEAAGGKILGLTREQEDGKQCFDALVKLDEREYLIRVWTDGRLVRMEVREPENGDELKLDDFPTSVKSALLKHAHGGDIKGLERERVSYGIKVKIGAQHYRVTVDGEGKLLKKEPVDE